MRMPKLYLDDDGNTFLICPHCGKQVKVNLTEFHGLSDGVKVKCPCKKAFRVYLGFRRRQRKNSFLRGYYVKLPPGEERGRMRVRDVSMGGIRFTPWSKHALQVGDKIRVQFVLDDDSSAQIEKLATVRWSNHIAVGCEFSDKHTFDSDLGFYFVEELASHAPSDVECSPCGTSQS